MNPAAWNHLMRSPNPGGDGDLSDTDGPESRGYEGGVVDPRSGLDRRDLETGGQSSGLERRRGPGRRRSDFMKSAEEGEMTPEQWLFLVAIDAFKKANNKSFPSWTDVLEVIRLLGYRKTCSSELNLPRAEDWLEKPDAPHGVRDRSDKPDEDE